MNTTLTTTITHHLTSSLYTNPQPETKKQETCKKHQNAEKRSQAQGIGQ